MNRHINSVSGRLSLRPPQRESLEILARVADIIPLEKERDTQAALEIIRSEFGSVTDFERDFKGQIKGLAFAIYKWLVMRQGVPTIKPDSNVKKFLSSVTGRSFPDREAVDVLERVAQELSIPANELDWSIWDYQRDRN